MSSTRPAANSLPACSARLIWSFALTTASFTIDSKPLGSAFSVGSTSRPTCGARSGIPAASRGDMAPLLRDAERGPSHLLHAFDRRDARLVRARGRDHVDDLLERLPVRVLDV